MGVLSESSRNVQLFLPYLTVSDIHVPHVFLVLIFTPIGRFSRAL